MNGYGISAHARLDLLQISNYVAEHNVEAAKQLKAEFVAAFVTLAANPGFGHQRPDVNNPRYLFYPVRSYLIVYIVGTKPLSIYRVIHGARDIKRIFRGK